MKNIYFWFYIMAFLSFSLTLCAQTFPEPQSLPYNQTFDQLEIDDTAYPGGFQGWTASTSPGSTFNTNEVVGVDRQLTANGTAASGTGNIYNYDGKIGFLNTGGLDLTIGFAFNATNQKAIQVQYDAMTIRNPYDVTANNTRINEMVLQYRVGTSAPFITLLPTAYSNNDVKQITAVTTPQNLKSVKITLPTECDNQPIVQLRWVSRQVSGSGSRPSFAIDNLDIKSDVAAPINVTGYPKADNILSNSFDFSNKLDEVGKTYYVLLPGGSTIPGIAQIKAGQDANGVAALQSGFFDITDPTQIYLKSFTALAIGTTYSVFSVSEDPYGNVQTSVGRIDVTTAAAPVPTLTTTVSALDLGFSESNYSETLSYQIQASNLSGAVSVSSSSSNFTLSKDNTTFGSTLTFTIAELTTPQTVYVRFTPTAIGSFSGEIKHESTEATTKTIALSGVGIDPYKQDFNDVNVLTNSGWTEHNVAGSVNKWMQTTIPRNVNSGTGAVVINGFSESGASKDWLISPKLHLNNFSQLPLLSFYSRKFYAGPTLKLMVSVNYDGKSNPETATWTVLNGNFPTITGTYYQSQYIDLSAYKTDHTYIAWVYETTAGGNNNAAEWSLDDVAITNESGFVAANPVFDFGEVATNAISASQSFVFKAEGYNDITIKAPKDYQLSLGNTSFQPELLITSADAKTGQTVYVRFTPSEKALSITGSLTVTGTGLNKQIGSLSGSSLLKADTFDVVTYNLEFFGSDVKGTDGVEFGPENDALQIENVAKVMNKLNADVYVVQEVSDDPSLDILIQKININGKTFAKSISTSWSYSFKDPEANFPPQKLAVLYNTQTTTVKGTRVMFKEFYDEVRTGTQTLPNYPSTDGNDDSFFSSGRLPYLVKIETNIGGIKKEINLIDLHARANSGSDISRYNMRKYDAELLKDSLDVYYPNASFMILGDFNDDVKASVIAGKPSSYQKIVEDVNNYNALTLGISQAGAYSFLSSGGFLDHIVISNKLTDQYIPNSIAVYDPRNDITNYTNTTSDHGPVIARFELKKDVLSTIDFGTNNRYVIKAYPNPATDFVNVEVNTKEDRILKLRLYDIAGHLVNNPIEIRNTQDKRDALIPLTNLRSGIYVYTLSENNKVIYSDKIIKK